MNEEDEEFERIEKEIKRRQAAEDDDTQEYAAQRQWVGLTKMDMLKINQKYYYKTFELMIAVEEKLKEKNT